MFDERASEDLIKEESDKRAVLADTFSFLVGFGEAISPAA
jgi:hypothetical protein